MAKKLIVPIIADSAGFKRGLSESERAAQKFEAQIKGTTSHVRTHILGMGAALIGVGGLAEGLKVSIRAAEELNVSARALNAQLRANKESVTAARPVIDSLNASMTKLGFTNSQTEQAFTRLDRASGSVAAATKYMGVTADLAAAKHIELSQAALLVGKVMTGTTTALNRYGIAIPKGTSATEALAIAQAKLAGQAQAAVTPQKQFHAVLTNIEATIGRALLPTVDKYLNKLTVWFSKSDNQRKVTDAVKTAVGYLKDALSVLEGVLRTVQDAFKKLSDAVGGNRHAIELLVGAFAAFKGATLLGSLAATATKLGLIGGAAVTAEGEVAALRTGLIGLGSASVLGPIALAVAGFAALAYASRDHSAPSGFHYVPTGPRTPPRLVRDTVTANYGPTLAQGGLAQGKTGAITPGLAALEHFAGGHVNDDFATKGHATNSYHYKGEAADLAVDQGVWARLYANRVAFAELFGPWGLYHYGVQFYDTKLQNQHMDHIHVAYTGGPTAISKMLGGTGATGTAAGGGSVSLPGDAAAAAAATKKQTAAATKAAAAAYKSWKTSYLQPIDNEYKADMLITDEAKRLNKLQALHAKLAIDLQSAKGKEHQDILNEEMKVQAKITAIHQKETAARLRIAALAAAEIKKQFDRVLSLDMTHILRGFDRAFAAQMTKFDKATAAGLLGLAAPTQTPEEKALADFIAQRASEQEAALKVQQQSDLAAAIASGDPAAIKAAQDAINQTLQDDQQQALQRAADASRAAADKKAADAQQAYQDARDFQKQGLQDINDDQRLALQNNLDDWTAWLDAKQKTYAQFLKWLRGGGIDTGGLISPYGGAGGATDAAGNPTFSANSLLGFADGGTVPGRLGAPMLAVVHGGETVIPVGGVGGVTNVFQFPNFVGSRDELQQLVVDAVARANRQGQIQIVGGIG